MIYKVAVIGQGYVGLPLSLAAANAGHNIIGVDINLNRVELLNSGISPIEDISSDQVLKMISEKKFIATNSFGLVYDCDIICICVPTPLGEDRRPDLGPLEHAITEVGKYLQEKTLVIVESTIQPGTTRDILIPILERVSGLSRDKFFTAYSPERIDPRNSQWNIKNTPKLIAGFNEPSADIASDFYRSFVDRLEIIGSLEVAETAKLLENSFRLINISFINELAIFCQKLGINILDVVNAAATKPYGFMPFYPGIGIGGHCIPVDPLYLSQKAKEIGVSSKLIDLADEINLNMPKYFVNRAEDILGTLKDKRIIVVGVAYKQNVADVRETPVEALILGLRQKGAIVVWNDDLVKEWKGEKSTALSEGFDLAVLATFHDNTNLTKLGSVDILSTKSFF
jgi:UDP-N-acetyl-D-glucosamine dehydrogenase